MSQLNDEKNSLGQVIRVIDWVALCDFNRHTCEIKRNFIKA